MSGEPRIDRIKFHKDIKGYFRDSPLAPFLVYDSEISSRAPGHYSGYTQLGNLDSVVVKVGTSIITHKDPRRTIYNMKFIAQDLTRLRDERGLNVFLITSGAIGLGRRARIKKGQHIPADERTSPHQKRQDAIDGQFLLYELWRHHFYPQAVEESLVTHADIAKSHRVLFQRYESMLRRGKIPIINENDAKSLEEIEIERKGERIFGDNDELAYLHASLLKKNGLSPLLILLSDTDGIYTRASIQENTFDSIRIVLNPLGLENQASPLSSSRGRGGVISKIEAASNAQGEGIPVVIANGQYCNHDSSHQAREEDSIRLYHVLDAILAGKVVGTRFVPRADK